MKLNLENVHTKRIKVSISETDLVRHMVEMVCKEAGLDKIDSGKFLKAVDRGGKEGNCSIAWAMKRLAGDAGGSVHHSLDLDMVVDFSDVLEAKPDDSGAN